MRFRYAKIAQLYIYELTDLLFDNHYFSYRDFAIRYVDSLIDEMEATIHIKQKRKAPSCFFKYGKPLYYVTYPKNKRTTWYFFFTYHPKDDIYFIRYITNNHVAGHLLE